MLFKTLQFELSDGVGRLTVHRPQSLNSLNFQVLRDLENFAKQAPKTMRVLILTGAGSRAFVAGADIKEMGALTPAEAKAFSEKGQRAFSAIEALPCPVLALVQGFALGGGLELALACDLLLLGEKARVGLPEVTLGLFPAFGGTQRLPRSIGLFKAKEMIFFRKFLYGKGGSGDGAGQLCFAGGSADGKSPGFGGGYKKKRAFGGGRGPRL